MKVSDHTIKLLPEEVIHIVEKSDGEYLLSNELRFLLVQIKIGENIKEVIENIQEFYAEAELIVVTPFNILKIKGEQVEPIFYSHGSQGINIIKRGVNCWRLSREYKFDGLIISSPDSIRLYFIFLLSKVRNKWRIDKRGNFKGISIRDMMFGIMIRLFILVLKTVTAICALPFLILFVTFFWFLLIKTMLWGQLRSFERRICQI